MLRNYLLIALRNLTRHKTFSMINIIGLSVGLACCITVFIFIQDELRYDAFHTNANRIYRLVNEREADGKHNTIALTPPAYGPALQAEFPEVTQSVRFFDMREPLVAYGDKKFFEPGFLLADAPVFEVFSFSLIKGDPKTALQAPHSLVITEKTAKKYFANEDPIGKTLTVAGDLKFTVTGVMRDLPAQSHLEITCLGAFNALKDFVEPKRLESWGWSQFYTYIMLADKDNLTGLKAKLPAFVRRHVDPENFKEGNRYQTHLQLLTDIHLHSSEVEYDIVRKGDSMYVYAFSAVAFFALLIACFNFMNLSTARSVLRAKEVGLRKVVGASRSQLIGQFMGESLLMTALALALSVGLVWLMLPVFNQWSGKALTLHSLFNVQSLVGLLGVAVIVGLLAGSYPAFFLSAFQPVRVLKGPLTLHQQSGISLRKLLVVVQFMVSTVLIISTVVVFRQLTYLQQKNLGFSKEQLIQLPLRNGEMRRGYERIKSELNRYPGIASSTACYGLPGSLFAGDGIRLPGKDREFSINMFVVDHDYIPTLDIKLAAGRNFSRSFGTDTAQGFILNETAVRTLGLGTPAAAIGQAVQWRKWVAPGTADSLKQGTVIGVVKDFHYKSLHQKIEPLVLHIFPGGFADVVVKVRPENTAATLQFLQQKWQALASDWPFEYTFLDEQFARKYESEQSFSKVFGLFTVLSIFISCLGLFGLVSFITTQRTKEIGIRKVLGASVTGIILLLSRDFLKLVLLAFVIAAPIAWYAMDQWLINFAYRIDISANVFIVAGLAALVIALLTVSFQAIKAALANPVKSLRSE